MVHPSPWPRSAACSRPRPPIGPSHPNTVPADALANGRADGLAAQGRSLDPILLVRDPPFHGRAFCRQNYRKFPHNRWIRLPGKDHLLPTIYHLHQPFTNYPSLLTGYSLILYLFQRLKPDRHKLQKSNEPPAGSGTCGFSRAGRNAGLSVHWQC